MRYRSIYMSLLASLILFGCSEKEAKNTKDDADGPEGLPETVTSIQRQISKGTPDNDARILWNHPSLSKIAEECGSYSRVIRLQDGSHMAVYEACSGGIVIKRSHDGGATWPISEEKRIVKTYTSISGSKRVTMRPAMPFICQLADGTILCANNFCPQTAGIVPYSIAVCRSTDNGNTWTTREIVYEGGTIFEDGCWEPAILQLPDGEVHLYFANEAPYSTSNKQEISFLTSTDSGKTWSKDIRTASIRSTGRDGMPCACIFEDEIVIIVEDVYPIELKPTTVRCKVAEKWSTPVTDNSPGRDHNLMKFADPKYAGAPFIIKLPSGEAVISFQHVNDNNIQTMGVAIGDRNARNFGKYTEPFTTETSLWNSLCVLDEYTIGAVGAKGQWPVIKKGHVMSQIKAEENEASRWPAVVRTNNDEELRAGVAVNDSEIIFDLKVSDLQISAHASRPDAVTVYFDSVDESWSKPYKGVFKIWATPSGKIRIWEGDNGKWVEIDARNVTSECVNDDKGYHMKIKVNRNLLPQMGESVRMGLSLAAYDAGGKGSTENLLYMSVVNPCTWLQVKLP